MAIEDADSPGDAGLGGEGVGDEEGEADAGGEPPSGANRPYTWADFDAEVEASRAEALGFDPARLGDHLGAGEDAADQLSTIVDERTVDVHGELDEDRFFTDERGASTVVTRYDLEKSVPDAKKLHFEEEERYWVNEPYSFVVIFHSRKENEKKYYLIEPYENDIEADLKEFLEGKLRTSIKYSEDGIVGDGRDDRREVIERESLRLMSRYDLYEASTARVGETGSVETAGESDEGVLSRLLSAGGEDGLFDGLFGSDDEDEATDEPPDPEQVEDAPPARYGEDDALYDADDPATGAARDGSKDLDGIAARPEPAVLAGDPQSLSEYQVEKLLYYLKRDFIGFEKIDGIKHDINVEDISCDGYDSPVFVYHSDYEQIITNVYHGETELDDFVVKLAQRSGKGISKRQPQVDATLPDGSRAQLTLGREVSDHGTNYTIRQFKDVPFTPVDLINWKTFSLEEMAFLWLCIENHKSLIFAGGTASGKTTSLNAVSLFIPSNSKIVSIEDTREVELPQRNWIASVTRPSFSEDDKGDVDEFDLLEAALRQRPDYIVMGEIRGEEGRTLFQVMSTGHTTYTTFHADTVGEVLKRFTTDPINVSKTMFTALNLVSIQTSTRVQGHKVRRNKSLTEINHYDAENDEINVQDVFQWQAETDEFLKMGESNTLQQIKFDRGWSQERLDEELFKRRAVLAYLIEHGLNTYTQVAATFQAFINEQASILALMANGRLETSLEDLREMESVLIDIDPERENMVPRPDPSTEGREEAQAILARAEEDLFPDYVGRDLGSVASALSDVAEAGSVEVDDDADGADGSFALADPDDDAAEETDETEGAYTLDDPTGDAPGDDSFALEPPDDGPTDPAETDDGADRSGDADGVAFDADDAADSAGESPPGDDGPTFVGGSDDRLGAGQNGEVGGDETDETEADDGDETDERPDPFDEDDDLDGWGFGDVADGGDE
jgi:flagellar protein FlaI